MPTLTSHRTGVSHFMAFSMAAQSRVHARTVPRSVMRGKENRAREEPCSIAATLQIGRSMSASDAPPAGHMPERVRRLPLRQNALRMDDAAQVARILERPVDALFLAGRGSGEEAYRQKNEHADRLRREDAID